MFNLYSLFVVQMSFCLIDDAKLRRFSAHYKLFLLFLSKAVDKEPLYGQIAQIPPIPVQTYREICVNLWFCSKNDDRD